MSSVISWKPEGLKGVVTLEGFTFDDVSNVDSKKLAIDEATKHLGLCGIGSVSGPYVVDLDGNEINDAEKIASLVRDNKGFKYRNDYSINQSIGF